MQGTELVVTVTLCIAPAVTRVQVLRKWRFSHFNEKFISRLCGNECFGVWPKHNYRYLFEGGILCLKNWFIYFLLF